MPDQVIDVITQPAWVGRTADTVGDAVKHAYAAAGEQGLRVKSALNGVWLGHPLHPALTDIPLGAWTTAVAFDAASLATGRDGLAGCATAAVAVGVAGAIASAVAGITDWSDTDGRSRRIGLVHGVLNLTATGLFATSLVMRQRAQGARGRVCGLLGYIVALGAAYLGGDLVFGEQIGVNHAAGQEVPEEFTPVLAASELQEGQLKRITIGTTPVLLVRKADTVYAIADTCSHLGGPLSEGTLGKGGVVCPWHGSCFALDDGHVVNGPATHSQPCFETRVRGGQLEIRMPRPNERAALEASDDAPKP
jgi:nitrite reductase/ring-hydroxylating ferredoxin subunit/uncharacterized membrane protein